MQNKVYGPYRQKKNPENNVFAHSSAIIWFDFHLSKAQGVVETSPIIPLHPVTVGRVIASQIEAVQVGTVTSAIPPGAFVLYGTRGGLVSSRGVHGNGEDWDPMGPMGFPREWE